MANDAANHHRPPIAALAASPSLPCPRLRRPPAPGGRLRCSMASQRALTAFLARFHYPHWTHALPACLLALPADPLNPSRQSRS